MYRHAHFDHQSKVNFILKYFSPHLQSACSGFVWPYQQTGGKNNCLYLYVFMKMCIVCTANEYMKVSRTFKVECVSSTEAGVMVQMMQVLALPPSDG